MNVPKLGLAAWTAVALTPAGWVLGIVLVFLSGEGEAGGIGPAAVGVSGILLFVAAPATAVVLAVRAARAGIRSGRIAVTASGSLLFATCVLTLLLGWTGLIVVAVVTMLIFAWARRPPAHPGPAPADRKGAGVL